MSNTLAVLTSGENGANSLSDINNNFAATVTETDAQTLTNKRFTSRVLVLAGSGTPGINTDLYDCVSLTAVSANISTMSTKLSGTPTNFQKLIVRFKDNGTARTIAWGSSFVAKGTALPTTTVSGKATTAGFLYDSVAAKWGCVANAQES